MKLHDNLMNPVPYCINRGNGNEQLERHRHHFHFHHHNYITKTHHSRSNAIIRASAILTSKGVTNYCIAVNWYYVAPFWVDLLLCCRLAGVMVLWRFCDVMLMAINHQSKFKSVLSDRCESVCLSV